MPFLAERIALVRQWSLGALCLIAVSLTACDFAQAGPSLFGIDTSAITDWVAPDQQARPAVVRVIVPERESVSFGSGTLVDVRGEYGLVLTNWHVVSEASGAVVVVFPNGFRSAAKVVKTDETWDLAALAIWKPDVAPVPLAPNAPQPGEALTIAGYGSGKYREAHGRCTQYVSPGETQPYEMVELSVSARQGDSGGPIFNGRGELAGVLFGSTSGSTAGSYCGRVNWFLNSVLPDAGGATDSRLANTTGDALGQTAADPRATQPPGALASSGGEESAASTADGWTSAADGADHRVTAQDVSAAVAAQRHASIDRSNVPPVEAQASVRAGLAADEAQSPAVTEQTSAASGALQNGDQHEPPAPTFEAGDTVVTEYWVGDVRSFLANASMLEMGRNVLAVVGGFSLVMAFIRALSPAKPKAAKAARQKRPTPAAK